MFSIEKVYTALNADEVAAGSKGYFADDLAALEKMVSSADTLRLLETVSSKNRAARFKPLYGNSCCLFYLVEEPEENKYRPYKDVDEMIEDFKKRYNSYGGWNGKDNPMYCPLIWIKSPNNKYLITRFDTDHVTLTFEQDIYTCSLEDLCNDYTYFDGTPCGIEE